MNKEPGDPLTRSKISGSRSDSSVLKGSTMANLPSVSLDGSGGSMGTQRVRIKRKHLKERQSPFEGQRSPFEAQRSHAEESENIPPALPASLPKDYDEVARRLSGSLSMPVGHMTRSPDNSAVNARPGSHSDHQNIVPPALPLHRPLSRSPRQQHQIKLKQGAPMDKEFFSQDTRPTSDVRVTKFPPGKRKQVMKESLSKRSEQTGPVRRVFEPRFVGRGRSLDTDMEVGQVAATAAAAVAATAPLLKYQHDLEHKMSLILDKLHRLETKSAERESRPDGSHRHGEAGSEELQKRLDELTLLKLQELERLRYQQSLLQDQIITENPSHLGSHNVHCHGKQDVTHSGITREIIPRSSQSESAINATSGSPIAPMNRRLPMGHLEPGPEQRMDPSNVNKQVHYAPAEQVHRRGLDNQVESMVKHKGQRSPSGGHMSPLHTPAPRKHVPVPHRRSSGSQPNGGLFQEILSHHEIASPHEKNRQDQRPAVPENSMNVADRIASSRSQAELQADRLLREIEDLRRDVSGKIKTNWEALTSPHKIADRTSISQPVTDKHQRTEPRKSTPESRRDAEQEFQRWQEKRQAPPPLDEYLRKDALPSTPPSRSPTHLDPGKTHVVPGRGPGQSSSALQQAETLLKRVQASRSNLEYNLDVIQRSKRDQQFYSTMNAIYADGDEAEKEELRQVVDRYITLMDTQVQEEMKKFSGPKAPHSPPTKLLPDKRGAMLDHQGKPVKPTKKKPVMARIDTGLRKPQEKLDQERGPTKEVLSREQRQGKDKRIPPAKKKPPVTSQRPPTGYKDNQYLSRVYGVTAPYQSHRSTLREAPYLRIANQSPAIKRSRPSPQKDVNKHTTHTQTPMGIIEPPVHPQIPVQRLHYSPRSQEEDIYQKYLVAAAPIRDTAIPLGAPRVGGERTEPVVIYNQLESMPQPTNQRQSNVAVVNVVCQKPQLEIKHLPPVDIDTEISSVSEEKVSVTSPPQELPELPVEQYKLGKHQMTDSEEDEMPDSTSALSFHGQPDDRQEYHGPPFPPEPPPPTQPQMRSDDIAAHLQKRELLEHRAVEWVEQELMARMISEFHSRLSRPEVRAPSPVSSESDHMVDAIGSGGLQLFIDAGQPVNPDIVTSLVREVLEEDIAKMLGQHQRNLSQQGILPSHDNEEHQPQDQENSLPQRLSTPEATPPHSPVDSPPAVMHDGKLQTPEPSYSEVSEEVEHEPELLKTEPIVQAPTSPVGTPPMTPRLVSVQSSDPGHIETPPASNREAPPLLHGDTRTLGTPSLTIDDETPPCSPIDVEESPQLSPEPTPPVEETTPPPSPPPERKQTPPLSSESTTTSTSPEITATETSGREISAGEWLISQQSQGQIPKAIVQGDLLGVLPGQGAEASQTTSSDTLLETDELEVDTAQEPAEEGEIRTDTNWQPMRDPMVAILKKLNQLPRDYQLPGGYRIPSSRPRGLYQDVPPSPGEVSEGQRPLLAPDVVNLLEGQIASTSGGNIPQSPGEVNLEKDSRPVDERPGEAPGFVNQSKSEPAIKDSTLRISDLNSGSSDSKESLERPGGVRGVSVAAPTLIHVQARRSSDEENELDGERSGKSSELALPIDVAAPQLAQVEPLQPMNDAQPELGNSGTVGMTGLLGSQTMSDAGHLSGTATPDAMNMEDLIQSGYLTRTFSQSDGFQVPPETRGALGGNGSTLQQTRLLGTTYGTTMTEDSLEVAQKNQLSRRQEGASKPKTVSITLPSTMQEDDSESEGSLPHETVSDVSEISGGDL